MVYEQQLKTDIIIIIEDYKNKFNDAPTIEDLIENDLEFEKLSQHLLVMHQITDYDGYTIIEQNNPIYRNWVQITGQPKFKKKIRAFWQKNTRILQATKNMASGTAMLTNLLGDVTREQLKLLHDIFYGKEKLRF